MSEAAARQHILFVGNPGTGKSTLLNSLVGSAVFKSGVSFGGGLTSYLQWHDHKSGFRFGDTPGLSDIVKRKDAAAEINKALRDNGTYRIVFVCTMEAGRIRPDDVTTIKTVLEAIDDNTFPYGIVLNKVTERIINEFNTNPKANEGIRVCLNYDHRPTDKIFLYPFDKNLEDKDNEVVKPNLDFLQFLDELPPRVLQPSNVRTIDVASFDKQRQELEQEIARLKEDSARMKEEADKQKRWLAVLGSAGGAVAATAAGAATLFMLLKR